MSHDAGHGAAAGSPILAAEPESAGGLTRFFPNQSYHFQTLRALSEIPYGGADTGEVLETIRHIRAGDPQSWFAAWHATGERVERLADATRDPLSKGRALLRAHNYYRTAEFFLPPHDPKRPAAWEQNIGAFWRGLDVLGVRYERFRAPYPGGGLQAAYYPGPEGADEKPLIVLVGGFDSTLEELYMVLVRAAYERGYSVLTYEGPGQGEAIRKQGLTFTHEWEKPNGAVLDAFLADHPAPPKTVLVGMSLGGYFAPRAAAFEPRIDGVVAYDTFFDVGETSDRYLAASKIPGIMANPDYRWAYEASTWTLGQPDIEGVAEAFRAYTLAPVAHQITQDVLILAGVDDHFLPIQQTHDFEASLVNARSVTTRIYDRASGGAEHCQLGAATLWHATVFDWLLEKFG